VATPAYVQEGSWTPPASSTVGIDIWQVNSGSVFDNIVADNLDEVNAIEKTWTVTKDAEKAALQAKEKRPTEYTKVEDTDDRNEKDDDDKEGLQPSLALRGNR
jgi:hypothetical protein